MPMLLAKTTEYYNSFNRAKLLSDSSEFNSMDFPPVKRDIVKRLFLGRVDIDEPWNNSSEPRGSFLESQIGKSSQRFSSFQAKLLTHFASYYSPVRGEPLSSAQAKSVAWYERLLSSAPVIIILRQKQRLFDEANVFELNPSLDILQSRLAKLSEPFQTDRDINKRTRNYHLTNLNSPDLFNIAAMRSGNSVITEPGNDKLYKFVRSVHVPIFLDRASKEILLSDVRAAFRKNQQDAFSLGSFQRSSDPEYDVSFSSFYILTIEEPVIGCDHQAMLDLIESSSDFDAIAVRLSASFIANFREEQASQSAEDPEDLPYEELVKWAATQRILNLSQSRSKIMTRCAGWGFVEAAETLDKKGLYLFKSSNES